MSARRKAEWIAHLRNVDPRSSLVIIHVAKLSRRRLRGTGIARDPLFVTTRPGAKCKDYTDAISIIETQQFQ